MEGSQRPEVAPAFFFNSFARSDGERLRILDKKRLRFTCRDCSELGVFIVTGLHRLSALVGLRRLLRLFGRIGDEPVDGRFIFKNSIDHLQQDFFLSEREGCDRQTQLCRLLDVDDEASPPTASARCSASAAR